MYTLSLTVHRLEVICQQPVLFLYHDFLTKGEMTYMKRNVLSDLVAAAVQHREEEEASTQITQSALSLVNVI